MVIKTKSVLYQLNDVSLQWIFYFLALFKFSFFFIFQWKKIKLNYKNAKRIQGKVLHYIISKNKNVSYLKEYNLKDKPSYLEFREKLPIEDYEHFRPYIEKNLRTGERTLTQEQPVFFLKTSGTKGLPKYIPITEEGKKLYKKSQNLMSFNLFLSNYRALNGKIFSISSPAREEKLNRNYFAGSMSGILQEESPSLIKSKFTIPPEILAILLYKDKYLLFTLIALCEENVSLLSTANPSTLLKLLSVIAANRKKLIDTLASGKLQKLGLHPDSIAIAQKCSFIVSSKRKKEIVELLQSKNKDINYFDIWPQLKSVITWTAGSCSYLIPQLKKTLPARCSIIDVGYLSSEFRGTVMLKGRSVPNIQEVFFEFAERSSWESGKKDVLRLHELKQEKQYYVFVTTFNGLYRYDINDIVQVNGYYLNTPCFEFVQKGKGTTNITGEKLYENQLIRAVNKAQKELQLSVPFFICLANQNDLSYTLYTEGINSSIHLFQNLVHAELCSCNIEYKEKTKSERLKPVQVVAVKNGTGEKYKTYCILKGQRDSQLKIQHLQYRKDVDYDFSQQIVTEQQG